MVETVNKSTASVGTGQVRGGSGLAFRTESLTKLYGGRGTADMVDAARAAGVRVVEIEVP